MRFAYADPPYPGKAGYYPEQREVDHPSLIDRLRRDYPDGWALSTSSEALRDVWIDCPECRLYIWVRMCRVVRSVAPLHSWEALLVSAGRPRRQAVVSDLRDVLIYQGRYWGFPGALVGMKPPEFAVWMFRLLGACQGDTLDDLFPGSGAVTEAWKRYVGIPETAQVPDLFTWDPHDGSKG